VTDPNASGAEKQDAFDKLNQARTLK